MPRPSFLHPLAAADDPALMGRKAVGLRLASVAGLPVPPALVLDADACAPILTTMAARWMR